MDVRVSHDELLLLIIVRGRVFSPVASVETAKPIAVYHAISRHVHGIFHSFPYVL